MCVDVETHDLAPARHERGWTEGTYGHERLKYDDDLVRTLRAVQVGWTIGYINSDDPPVTKSQVVKPDGFVITDAVAKIHGIEHANAVAAGNDIACVLDNFLKDVQSVVNAGGRICAHQIEFDADIIDAELYRSGFAWRDRLLWHTAVRNGLCTMNHILTSWCCDVYRRSIDQFGNGDKNRDTPCPLGAVAWTLVPPCEDLRAKQHDAGNDSRVGFLVTKQLHVLIHNVNGAMA